MSRTGKKRETICYKCDGIPFDYYGVCPTCGRDREGLTKEERMKRRSPMEIAGVLPVGKQRRRKSPATPFEGEATNIKWS